MADVREAGAPDRVGGLPWAIFVLGFLACVPGALLLVLFVLGIGGLWPGAAYEVVVGVTWASSLFLVPAAALLDFVLVLAWIGTRRRRGDYVALGFTASTFGLLLCLFPLRMWFEGGPT